MTIFIIYAMAGRDIFQKRKQLRSFQVPPPDSLVIGNPFNSYKTTEVHITSELVALEEQGLPPIDLHVDQSQGAPPRHGYQQYSVTIERCPMSPVLNSAPTTQGNAVQRRQNNAALEANTAAWGYTKCAILFFLSLLITWVTIPLDAHPFLLGNLC